MAVLQMPPASLRDTIAHVASVLRSVPGVGNVHTYRRWTRDPAKYLALLKPAATDQLNAWWVTRRSTRRRRENDGDRVVVVHEIRIEGILTLHDPPTLDAAAEDAASAPRFCSLVEAVCDKFEDQSVRANTMGGTVLTSDPVQVATEDERMFGDHLVHFAELGITVKDARYVALTDRVL